MKLLGRVLCLGVLLGLTAASVSGASTTVMAKDLAGVSHTFFSKTNANAKALVFIFVLADCPICNFYASELRRLRQAFPQIDFYLVYADPDIAVNEARQHSKDYNFGFPGLLDPAQQLVRKSGATRTPEAAVFSPEGKLLYRGRIDDRYVDYGKRLDHPRQRDLQNALESIVQNKPAIWPKMAPIGCFIPTKANPDL
ncbi:MAG: redoxin family protein [Verrucomicrobiota bacterium]